MPRPNSKEQLVSQAREEYEALTTYLDTLTPELTIVTDVVGAWSVKDVVAHLTEWAQMVKTWYAAGKRGEVFSTPAEGYSWQQIPALNQKIYEQHQDDPLAEVLEKFHITHAAMMDTISEIDNDELFTPNVYKWTKSTT